MRLTTFTDNALRLLIDLARPGGGQSTIADIARRYGMSANHLAKVVVRLSECGVLRTVRGRRGGVTLACAPEQIRLGAVVRASEPDFCMVDCFDEAHASCCYRGCCGVQQALARATEAYLAQLDGLTLADLLAPPSSPFGLAG